MAISEHNPSANSEKKEFIIPVSWEVYSNIVVRGAESLEEARKLVEDNIDAIPLSRNPEYIDGSYKIDAESEKDLENAQSYTAKGVLMECEPGKDPRYTIID